METQKVEKAVAGKGVSLGLLGLLAALVLSLGLMAGPIAKSPASPSQEGFCGSVNLSPYGQQWDKCWAWVWQAKLKLSDVRITTHERAGCVSYSGAEGYDIQDSWYCVGKGTYGIKWVRNDGQVHRGVIRNNNLSYSGVFSGGQTCCYE